MDRPAVIHEMLCSEPHWSWLHYVYCENNLNIFLTSMPPNSKILAGLGATKSDRYGTPCCRSCLSCIIFCVYSSHLTPSEIDLIKRLVFFAYCPLAANSMHLCFCHLVFWRLLGSGSLVLWYPYLVPGPSKQSSKHAPGNNHLHLILMNAIMLFLLDYF